MLVWYERSLMELRHLRNFVTVVEQKSISKAANIVRLAQSALSRQVQALENDLGTTLLVRHGRGITPTPEGEVLAKSARSLLDQAQAVRDAVGAASGSPSGTLALGVPSSMAEILLPELALAAQRDLPRVQLRLVEGYSATLRQKLLTGELDVAILYADRRHSSLVTRPLLSESLVAIGPPGCFGREAVISIQDLVSRMPIMPASANQLRSLFEEAAAEQGLASETAMEVDSVPALLALVAAGAGVSVLPYSTICRALAAGRLSYARIGPDRLDRHLVLARAQERIETPSWNGIVSLLYEILTAGEQTYHWNVVKPS
jgi:LysR family transcriptional regulator, nitrogen assimilation regulatory protein